MLTPSVGRRDFLSACGMTFMGLTASATGRFVCADQTKDEFRLNYIVASSLYGRLPLEDVIAQVPLCGAEWLDIWPESHANHREQMESLGRSHVASLLATHKVQIGIFTCYNPGLLKLTPWMEEVKSWGGQLVISNSPGPSGLSGDQETAEIKKLAELLKPLVEKAESLGVTIGVENHSGSLINGYESQLRLLDEVPSRHLGIALAPYHLPQDSASMANHIRRLGERLVHFYAWEHGDGCMTKLPKVKELKQLPGHGNLDFVPLVQALKDIRYPRWTSIFMHPVPRGIPILNTAAECTAAINRSREFLDDCLKAAMKEG